MSYGRCVGLFPYVLKASVYIKSAGAPYILKALAVWRAPCVLKAPTAYSFKSSGVPYVFFLLKSVYFKSFPGKLLKEIVAGPYISKAPYILKASALRIY